ncbi:YjgN family protein [Acinetobacter silvestris]|uniref:DUF898 domain-containing protein n=1 Tax=Acinetobacter silvestris TaxID=1977882 RepID=A0A1Y3CB89_9GAMM|nr:YjgN family protein [Acinetobacter silvestris]OTG62914.1 hypothetical protein B9T28_13950 [Acinetobacter silvestris]
MQEQQEHIFSESHNPRFPSSIPTEPPTQRSDLAKVYRFKFHGEAMEYFGIWIVNILLTIATLSLYAPWAKVRRLRYFYSNTEFFQRFFDFTGLPTKILIGRLIAISIWAAFAVAGYLEMRIAVFGGLFIYLALPWLLRATIRFTSRNSKYANSRFYFDGTNKEAYKQFFLSLLIIVFTLGLFTPVVIWLYKRYVLNHLYAGQLKFKLNNSWADYMSAVYVPIFLLVGIFIILIILLIILGMNFSHNINLTQSGAGIVLVIYICALIFVRPLIQARIFITTWNNTTISQSQFKTDCNQWRYAWIVASNWIVKILSIGLMSAWAAIRLYKYQVESLSLHLQDDPDRMMNMIQTDHSAIAEEISDIFDLDISL